MFSAAGLLSLRVAAFPFLFPSKNVCFDALIQVPATASRTLRPVHGFRGASHPDAITLVKRRLIFPGAGGER
jgi:hypothetical protein